jgi:hypothetical protein
MFLLLPVLGIFAGPRPRYIAKYPGRVENPFVDPASGSAVYCKPLCDSGGRLYAMRCDEPSSAEDLSPIGCWRGLPRPEAETTARYECPTSVSGYPGAVGRAERPNWLGADEATIARDQNHWRIIRLRYVPLTGGDSSAASTARQAKSTSQSREDPAAQHGTVRACKSRPNQIHTATC